MLVVEPCCTQKHLLELRHRLGDDGTVFWRGYGDLSLVEILPVLLTRYTETELMIVAPNLPDMAVRTIKRMMARQLASIDGKGKLNTIAHLLLISDLRSSRSPAASAWVDDNPFGERLTLHNVQQNDTAIILPDIALYGNINLTYCGHFSAIATKNARTIQSLRKMYYSLL